MSGEIAIQTVGRSADGIAMEIRAIAASVTATALHGAWQIGQRLEEAKKLVPHGEWGDYIAHRVGMSQSQCNNMMRIYREYDLAALNSQSIGNLMPTQALALLALPADQREQFAEEHQGESVRQLKAEIAKLTKRAEKAEEKVSQAAELMALATEENGALKQRLNDIDADYKAQLDTVDRENDKLRAELKTACDNNGILGERASRAEIEAANLRHDLDAARDKPAEITPEQAEALRQEGADAAMDAQREIIAAAEAKVAALAAEKDSEIAQLRALLEKSQKERPANADSQEYKAFKAVFEGISMSFVQLLQCSKSAAPTPEQEAANLNAVRGLLIKLGQKVGLKLTTA